MLLIGNRDGFYKYKDTQMTFPVACPGYIITKYQRDSYNLMLKVVSASIVCVGVVGLIIGIVLIILRRK